MISVVIPNLNGEKLLRENIPDVIAAKNYTGNMIDEIIVVDDGSWDQSVNLIKSKFPDIKLIRLKANRGFSAAVNTGVRSAKGELIVLLNTDVAPSNDFLVKVIPHFKDSRVFAVSLHEKGYGFAKATFTDGYIRLIQGEESKEVKPSLYVSGGSGVFRRKIWIELGGMDERLLSPFYWEDIDIGYRAAKRGYLNLWEPEALVKHSHESTISSLPKDYVERIRERNQLLMLWKNITSPNLARRHVIGLFSRLVRHPGYLRVVFMALAKLGIALERRRREVRESKISDEVIFARFS